MTGNEQDKSFDILSNHCHSNIITAFPYWIPLPKNTAKSIRGKISGVLLMSNNLSKLLAISVVLLIFTVAIISAGVIEQTYTFSDYKITNRDGYQIVNFKRTHPTGKVGEPVLPYHAVSLLLPPGEIAESIEILGQEETIIPGEFQLYPRQYSRPISIGKSGVFVKSRSVYESSEQYPKKLYGEISTHYMNGYSFVLSTFTPLQYYPKSGKVSFFKKITVKIMTTPDIKSEIALSSLSASNKIRKRVQTFAQNPNLISTYPGRGGREDEYQLLIITPTQFENSLQDLIDLYLVRGLRTEMVTTDFINSSVSGYDLQERIRNYIIQEYQNHSIEYVTFVGDVEHIPYRGFYCAVQSSQTYEDDDIPSDLYYSALDGSWNNDGDNRWGEIGEDDLLPEVSVARLPISDLTELNNSLNKIISYQNNPVQGELDKPFLVGEYLWDDPLTWGGDYLDLLVGCHDDSGYTTCGIPEDHNFETLYDRDVGNWYNSTLLGKINEGKSFIHHSGHANWNYCMRLNSYDITNSNFSQLDGINHNYTLVYTHGCYSGAFDYDDCIAEKMVNLENFAVAFVGNSRYGWFNEGQTEGPSHHLHREFVDALYRYRTGRIGETHLLSKIDTAPWVNAPGQWEEGALRWCFYDCNVLGDPTMSVWTDEPITIQATYNDTISTGTSVLPVTVSSNDSIVEGLTCVLINEGEILGSSVVDENGDAEIVIGSLLSSGDTLDLVISGYNCLPTTYFVYVSPQAGIQNELMIPEIAKLEQNYPNPFNPSTTIIFDLPDATEIEIIIYDILGKQVEVLVRDRVLSGRHKVVWDASEFPGGIYFCRLTTHHLEIIRKMLLLK